MRKLFARVVFAWRHYGAGAILQAFAFAVARYTPLGWLRILTGRQPFPANDIEQLLQDARARRRKGDRLALDEAYTLPAATFERWRARRIAPPAGTTGLDQGAERPLVFIVQDARETADISAETRAAVLAADPSALLLAGGERRSGASGDDIPDAIHIFVCNGDRPYPDMAVQIRRRFDDGVTRIATFDFCRIVGERIQPISLPGANAPLLAQTNYVFSRLALDRALIAADAFVDPRETVLRRLQEISVERMRAEWTHVPLPLLRAEIPEDSIRAERQRLIGARPPARQPSGSVAVVICTKDKGHLARQLVRQLTTSTHGSVAEIAIIANGTSNPYALQALEDLARQPGVTVQRADGPFNFSRLSNMGARLTRTGHALLFLNDDIAPVTDRWLEAMLARLEEPEVGVVGPLLLYPDETVQHAGMYLGYMGAAGHVLRSARLPEEDYLFTASACREVRCVTGAALLTRRAAFEAVGGLDEELAISLQDVDYCLRLSAAGFRTLFEPASILLHMESTSLRRALAAPGVVLQRRRERELFVKRWGASLQADPFHLAAFSPNDEQLRRLVD